GTQNHILGRHSHGTSIGGLQQVVGSQHQETGFCLCLCGQGHVNSHLVAVEVSVICGTHQGVQLQSTALYQHRLKSLNAQTVQRRCTVQQHGVILDDDFQSIPNLGLGALYSLSGSLDVAG